MTEGRKRRGPQPGTGGRPVKAAGQRRITRNMRLSPEVDQIVQSYQAEQGTHTYTDALEAIVKERDQMYNPIPHVAEQILSVFHTHLGYDDDTVTLAQCWQAAEGWASVTNNSDTGWTIERTGSMNTIVRTTRLFLSDKELDQAIAMAHTYDAQRQPA